MASIVHKMSQKISKWLGNVLKETDKSSKISKGKRGKGRPRKSWLNEIKSDMKKISVS